MIRFGRILLVAFVLASIAALGLVVARPAEAGGQVRDLTTPEGIYAAGCAACHGPGGRGADLADLGFDVPLPDFSDCNFATREPDADWFAVVHQGGPVRGFAINMPAYGQAFSDEQIQMALDHLRTFCDRPSWPRGELNYPRAMVTEKAFPEDELVWTTDLDVEGDGAIINELLYERRLGARNQLEVKVPFGVREVGPEGDWSGGIGDVAVGAKRVLVDSLARGTILSIGGEVVLPTGDAAEGFGSDTTLLEPFASAGFALPRDAFAHVQIGGELSTDTEVADHEAFWRGVLGTTFTQGRFGRAWSPMVELLGTTEFGDEATENQLDLLPQLQVTLNTRQHVMVNVGLRFPVTDASDRDTRVLFYVLWEWFDGGFFEGW